MTVNKTDIIKSIMQNVRLKNKDRDPQRFLFPEMNCTFLTKKRASEIIDALFETIKQALTKGEDVLISNFGKFQVKFKLARKGRNPQTGEMIILRSRRIVTFRAASKLKDKLTVPSQGHDSKYESRNSQR